MLPSPVFLAYALMVVFPGRASEVNKHKGISQALKMDISNMYVVFCTVLKSL